MANNKQRYINTKIWNDNYVSQLDPTEKLLFIYLLSNEHTNISGIYEVPLKIIAIETGIEVSMLQKIFSRLEEKIRYINGRVVIKNHIKHQELNSPNIIKGISNCLNELDQNWLKTIIKKGYYISLDRVIDTPYIPPINPSNYSNSNSNSNSNSIELPNWLDKKNWGEWVAYRKEIKKTLKPSTIKLQLALLEKHQKDHIQIIKNSITNGWTGLFEIKPMTKGGNSDYARAYDKKIQQDREELERKENERENDRFRKISEQSRALANKFDPNK